MSDFTPGPWAISVTDRIVNSEGERVAEAWLGREEWPANVRLLAAAPELYEALEGLLSTHTGGAAGFKGQCCFEADRAIDVLRKARGECAYCGSPESEHEPSGCCGDGGGSTFEAAA